MSLIELKQLAKGRRIKQYYIMRRAQLIELLKLTEMPRALVLEKKTIIELRQEAKQKGMRGFWRMTRGQLLTLLYPEPKEDDDNNSQASQHD